MGWTGRGVFLMAQPKWETGLESTPDLSTRSSDLISSYSHDHEVLVAEIERLNEAFQPLNSQDQFIASNPGNVRVVGIVLDHLFHSPSAVFRRCDFGAGVTGIHILASRSAGNEEDYLGFVWLRGGFPAESLLRVVS